MKDTRKCSPVYIDSSRLFFVSFRAVAAKNPGSFLECRLTPTQHSSLVSVDSNKPLRAMRINASRRAWENPHRRICVIVTGRRSERRHVSADADTVN